MQKVGKCGIEWERYAIFSVMGYSQPLIIYKSRQGKDVLQKTFRSTNEAKKWLRTEGCTFRNSDLVHIQNYRLTLSTNDFDYEIEGLPYGYKRKVRIDG